MAEFECKIENIKNANEYNGLEIISSKYISGIPIDSKKKLKIQQKLIN